jgi:hypothetical protein
MGWLDRVLGLAMDDARRHKVSKVVTAGNKQRFRWMRLWYGCKPVAISARAMKLNWERDDEV